MLKVNALLALSVTVVAAGTFAEDPDPDPLPTTGCHGFRDEFCCNHLVNPISLGACGCWIWPQNAFEVQWNYQTYFGYWHMSVYEVVIEDGCAYKEPRCVSGVCTWPGPILYADCHSRGAIGDDDCPNGSPG